MIKAIVRLALITAAILVIPVLGNMYIDGWNWSGGDLVFASVMIFGTGFLFELARMKASSNAYKLAVGLLLAGAFTLIWVNGAVGIIGDSDVNIFYGLVILTLLIGSFIARFKPEGMSLTLFTAAAVQFMVPVVALIINKPDFSPGVIYVFILNFFWVMLFVGSGILFRQSSTENSALKSA